MKISPLVFFAGSIAALAGYGGPVLADVAAGKATFTSTCSECHDVGDFEGEDPAEIAATIKQIASGQMKHKTAFKLTDEQIADMAAYLVSGGK